MAVLPWVPLADDVAVRLDVLAQREGISSQDLASRILTSYTKSKRVRGVRAGQQAAVEAEAALERLERLIERHWTRHPGHRTGVENIVMAAVALVREVNNGGFDQFFRNSSARWAGFAPDAWLHIGRKDAARIAKRALRAAGGFRTPADFEARMSRPNLRRDDRLGECDIEFCQLAGLPESVLAYARSHPHGLLRV